MTVTLVKGADGAAFLGAYEVVKDFKGLSAARIGLSLMVVDGEVCRFAFACAGMKIFRWLAMTHSVGRDA